jgi:hypothetical protein
VKKNDIIYLYTSRLQKGGALLEDVRILIRIWDNDATISVGQTKVIEENILGKKTRKRAKDVIMHCFVPRFIKGDPPEAWRLMKVLEDRNLPLEILKPIYYWITARSERLIYDYVTDKVFTKSKGSDYIIRMDETIEWIKKRLSEQKKSWSNDVTKRVASGLLSALRDFGILEGKGKKRIAPVYLPIESFSYIVFVLYSLGTTPEKIISHKDWKLFLMVPQVVERLFLEAHQMRLLHFQAAGNIYRIEFFAKTIEEMADVIAERSF